LLPGVRLERIHLSEEMTGPLRDATNRIRSEQGPVIAALRAFLADPGVQAAFLCLSAERRWLDEQHLQICRVPAPTFFEQQRAEWVRNALSALGWAAQIDRAGNVLAQLPGVSHAAPLVALTAHLDTVLAPQVPEDIRLDDRQKMTGPGVADNGAGLAGLLAVARVFHDFQLFGGLGAQLLLVANVGEEGDGNLNGMRYLCRQSPLASRIRSFLVLDGPSTDHITTEALGCRRYEIVVSGPGGHSWSDFGTANPIHALSRTVAWFVDIYAPRAISGGSGRHSFNFGVIDGGTTVNAIPASARVKVDLRAEHPALLDALAQALAHALEDALLIENERATTGRVTAKRKETGNRPWGALSEGSALLSYIRAVDSELGIRASIDCASTDANVPLSLGLPALSIGAGGEGGGAHTTAEWYSPEGRDIGLRRVVLLLGLMLGEPGAE
jgi:acetylornithine deacetylase/succinyl-diaminopimelate desuccinylase-like protein